MARIPVAALMAMLLAGTQASAAPAKGRSAKQTAALAPAQADGDMSRSALDGIDRALASHAGANTEVVGTKALDKRVKPDFAGAVRQCKRDAACLSRLTKNLRVDLLLVPTAKPESRGTALTIHVAGDRARKVSFVFVTSADLNGAILANSATLFGDGSAAPQSTEELAALPLEPPPPPAEPKPEPQPAPAAIVEPAIVPPPATSVTDPGVLEPPPLDDSIVIRREEPLVTWKTYVGAPAAVIGAAAATYGILQYAHHKSLVNDANSNPNLTQREAAAIDDDAQSAYDRSQVAVFVGTPLLIIGTALVVWDLFVDDHSLTSSKTDEGLSLSVFPDGAGGASGSLGFRF